MTHVIHVADLNCIMKQAFFNDA